MSQIAIVTDSLACIRKEDVERYKIEVVPVIIFFEGRKYYDWIDISPAQGYEFLERAPEFWESSAASPEDYLKVYQDCSKYAENILVITVSVKLSMFYNSAQTAKEMAKEKLAQTKIEIFDTETTTAAEGFIALAAAKAAAEGGTLDEVISVAKKVKERVKLLIFLNTMRHVYRTGRIPKIAAQIASRLSIKPILTISKGIGHFVTATRTRASGIERMLRIMKNHVGNLEPIHVAVMHADALGEAEALKQRIAAEFNCAELFITDFSPTMGYATGRGTLALAYYKSL